MKRATTLLSAVLTVSSCFYAQTAKNPFAKLGYNKKQLLYTSSKGEYEEFHDQTDVVEIGSVLFNTKTNQITAFVSEEKASTEVSPAIAAMSIDPLCEKYYWISPYAYCMNNPVKFIDPTGMWIQYKDDTGYYRYDNGQWYQYQTEGDNIGQYTAFTPESGSFLDGVLKGLNELNKNATGSGLISFFANDDNNAFLVPGEKNEADISDSVLGTIVLSSDFQGSEIPTEKGNQTSPFWLDIGHELAHRQDVIKNGADQAETTWLTKPDNGKPIKTSEKYATHQENLMRANAGLPLRTHYASQGNGGWEPSRILKTGTRISIYNKIPVAIGGRIYPGVPKVY